MPLAGVSVSREIGVTAVDKKKGVVHILASVCIIAGVLLAYRSQARAGSKKSRGRQKSKSAKKGSKKAEDRKRAGQHVALNTTGPVESDAEEEKENAR